MSLILDGTNGVSDIDGSAATPAIRGTDANTGIFFPAADTIAFSEGGVESMRLNSSGTLVTTNDASISGLTVGKGGGALTSNTVVGLNAQVATAGGGEVTAIGNNALTNNISTTSLTAVGSNALFSNTTGQVNVGVGKNTLYFNTTGSFNVALGMQALQSNTTASFNTAVGYQAGFSNTTGTPNTFVGYQAGYANTTGVGNTVMGFQAFDAATTGNANTIVGNRAGGAITTGANNVIIGADAGAALTTGVSNCFIGATGARASGEVMTTGSKNTILGSYDGNYGGLDIRTASNRIVLSDGDGNPYAYWGSTGQATFRSVGVDNRLTLTSSAAAFSSRLQLDNTSDGGAVVAATFNVLTVQTGGTGGVNLNAGATAWVAVSDERVKENLIPITDAVNKVASLRAVTGNYTWDESKKSRAFLIAQDVLEVLPEAVETKNPDELGLAYTDVIPLLVAAIKELKAEIDQLKGN